MVVEAQIVPDGSLPTKVQQLQEIMKINGGERAGNNLFHSFDEFNLPEGMEAIFENASDIENIFTRITGDSISNIDGILSTQGTANLFLVNPNGIVFGKNAAIDVGGSFIATTADNIEFNDGIKFSASDADSNPILTMEFPIGLGFGSNTNPGAITVNGDGNQISRQGRLGRSPYHRNRRSGLSVPSGETFALVGNRLNFNNSAIVTEGGQVKIGSVSLGKVKLQEDSQGWVLSYEEVSAFEDINFYQNTLIDASGTDSSFIEIYGKNINLADNSILLIQNDENTSTNSININASNDLNINEKSTITTETIGEGNASSIEISASNLFVKNQGGIVSATFDSGRSGDIKIAASKKLQVFDAATTATPEGIISLTNGSGSSGNIIISAQELQASQGASITSTTVGAGNAGNLALDVDSIELEGTTEKNATFTFIGSASLGEGNAGKVNINAANLKILNGAAISSDSSSDADAGNITINASNLLEVKGIDSKTMNQSSINSSVTIQENEILRQALGLPATPNGKAGNITIDAPNLNIAEKGIISVNNKGTGIGGTLTINADNLNLDTTGSITATTASGTGGNINIASDDLQIDNNSEITATADNSGEGGNITINITNLTAKKQSNSG